MLNSAERSLIPKLQHIENSNSLAPKAVYLLKTGIKLSNKLNLSTSSQLGLNKHLFLRQQKITFFFFLNISFKIWRRFFFPASFSFAVIAIKDAIQFKWLQLTPNSGKKEKEQSKFLKPNSWQTDKSQVLLDLILLILIHLEHSRNHPHCRTGTQTLNPAKCFLLVCIKDRAIDRNKAPILHK